MQFVIITPERLLENETPVNNGEILEFGGSVVIPRVSSRHAAAFSWSTKVPQVMHDRRRPTKQVRVAAKPSG